MNKRMVLWFVFVGLIFVGYIVSFWSELSTSFPMVGWLFMVLIFLSALFGGYVGYNLSVVKHLFNNWFVAGTVDDDAELIDLEKDFGDKK